MHLESRVVSCSAILVDQRLGQLDRARVHDVPVAYVAAENARQVDRARARVLQRAVANTDHHLFQGWPEPTVEAAARRALGLFVEVVLHDLGLPPAASARGRHDHRANEVQRIELALPALEVAVLDQRHQRIVGDHRLEDLANIGAEHRHAGEQITGPSALQRLRASDRFSSRFQLSGRACTRGRATDCQDRGRRPGIHCTAADHGSPQLGA